MVADSSQVSQKVHFAGVAKSNLMLPIHTWYMHTNISPIYYFEHSIWNEMWRWLMERPLIRVSSAIFAPTRNRLDYYVLIPYLHSFGRHPNVNVNNVDFAVCHRYCCVRLYIQQDDQGYTQVVVRMEDRVPLPVFGYCGPSTRCTVRVEGSCRYVSRAAY